MESASGAFRRVTGVLDNRRDGLFVTPAALVGVVVLGSVLGALLFDLSLDALYVLKQNPLNRFFVKLGWMWTVLPLLASEVVHTLLAGRVRAHHLAALAACTVLWFMCTGAFEAVNEWSGECSVPAAAGARACSRARGHWSGWDVSGHVFLLAFSSLAFWELAEPLASLRASLQSHSHSPALLLDIAVRCWATAIRLIWLAMLLVTALFFHTVASKLVALALAFACWWLVFDYAVPLVFSRYLDRHYLLWDANAARPHSS